MIGVTFLVLGALVCTAALRRRSAAVRHWVLAAAIAGAGILPLLQPLAPAWPAGRVATTAFMPAAFPKPRLLRSTPSADAGMQHTQSEPRADTWSTLWSAGIALSVFGLVVGFLRLRWLASRATTIADGRWQAAARAAARQVGLRRNVTLLQSTHPSLLVTWGTLRPKIILPAGAGDWPDDRVRAVLLHEMAHIRRGDWAWQVAAEALRAVYWFNPVLWFVSRRLRQESERACDDVVLELGVSPSEYAAHLLAVARVTAMTRRGMLPQFPAPAMVQPSSLERRIVTMLKPNIDRRPATTRGRVVAGTGILLLAAAIAVLGAAAQSLATFSGSVVDPMSLGVPRVTLVLTHQQTKAKHEVRSDEKGNFEFAGLPAGIYDLEAKLPGFASLTGQVEIAGLDVQRTLKLELGTLQETVRVAHSTSGALPPPPPPPPPPPARGVSGGVQGGVNGGVPAGVAGARREEPCQPSVSGGKVRPPRKLRDVRPAYPAQLAAKGIAGSVLLEARIGTDGFVREVTVVDAPHAEFGKAAADAVRQWQFDSTLLNCVATEVAMMVRVTFEIVD
jgi:TonB family protein